VSADMKSILTIIATFFIIISISSSVPVWKKHAELDIKSEDRERLRNLLFYSKTEWLYQYEDSTHKYHIYYTKDSGNTYTNLTQRFKESIGNLTGESRMYVTKSKHLVVVKTGNLGYTIWFSDDIGISWISDSLIGGSSLYGMLFHENAVYIRHGSTSESAVTIYKYFLSNNIVKKELFYIPENDLSQIRDEKFDINKIEELFVALSRVSMIYSYYYPRIYDGDRNLISELDFNADYFPYEYNPTENDNGLVSKVKNIKDSIWMMTMRNNGYFITYNNGKDWEFIDIDEQYKGTNGDYEFVAVKDKPYYLSTISNFTYKFTYDLNEFGEPIRVVDENNEIINNIAGEIYPFEGDEIFSYGSGSTIFILDDIELTSVKDSEYLINDISVSPNPVSDLLQIKSSSGIGLESIIIYDLLGNRVLQTDFNSFSNNRKIDCSSLAIGTYVITIQTKSGVITKKFIKQ
jgi:type IX secretion system substrate protein